MLQHKFGWVEGCKILQNFIVPYLALGCLLALLRYEGVIRASLGGMNYKSTKTYSPTHSQMCIFCRQNYVSKNITIIQLPQSTFILNCGLRNERGVFFKRLWDHLKIKEQLDFEVDNVFYSGLNDSWNSIKSICPLRKNITIKNKKT